MVADHIQGFPPPVFAQPSARVEHNMSDSFDLSKLFDEDYSLHDHEALAPRPIAPSTYEANPSGIANAPTGMVPVHATSTNQGGNTQVQGNQLVNVLLIVDPSTQQVIFPRQQQQQQQLQQEHPHHACPNTMFSPNSVTDSGFSLSTSLKNCLPPTFSLFDNGAFNFSTNTAPAPPAANVLHQALSMQVQHELAVKLAQQAAEGMAPAKAAQPPLRALSAYNFFFRDERDRILNDTDHDWSAAKQDSLLRAHWSRDRSKKRRHRKTHGKIDFTSLSKLISSRWKALPENRKEFYREVAARDWERYQEELSLYKDNANLGFVQNTLSQGFLQSSTAESSLTF